LLAAYLDVQAFGGWMVGGWLEELNDLVYFIDLDRQLRREPDRIGFAKALFEDCEEQFYEHGYREDLFPDGRPQVGGLDRRVSTLCDQLAGKVIQTALFLMPGLPCHWLAMQ